MLTVRPGRPGGEEEFDDLVPAGGGVDHEGGRPDGLAAFGSAFAASGVFVIAASPRNAAPEGEVHPVAGVDASARW